MSLQTHGGQIVVERKLFDTASCFCWFHPDLHLGWGTPHSVWAKVLRCTRIYRCGGTNRVVECGKHTIAFALDLSVLYFKFALWMPALACEQSQPTHSIKSPACSKHRKFLQLNTAWPKRIESRTPNVTTERSKIDRISSVPRTFPFLVECWNPTSDHVLIAVAVILPSPRIVRFLCAGFKEPPSHHFRQDGKIIPFFVGKCLGAKSRAVRLSVS